VIVYIPSRTGGSIASNILAGGIIGGVVEPRKSSMLRGEPVHLEDVISGVSAREKIGVAPHHIVERHDAADLDPGRFVGVTPGEARGHAGELLDIVVFLSARHDDLFKGCDWPEHERLAASRCRGPPLRAGAGGALARIKVDDFASGDNLCALGDSHVRR
jgi:hypothetical protein